MMKALLDGIAIAISGLMAVLAIPILVVNWLGGIISGVWLAFLGEWLAIGIGVIGLFSHLWLSLLLALSFVVVGPGVALYQKGHRLLAYPLLTLGTLYTYALIVAWCVGVFQYFHTQASAESLVPMMIWSYGVALGPWMVLADYDRKSGNDTSTITTFFAQVGYISMAIMAMLGVGETSVYLSVFVGIMLIGAIIQALLAAATFAGDPSKTTFACSKN